MTARLFKRIEKLEGRRSNLDQVLLLWIMPGKDVQTAVRAARDAGLFRSGDMVVCVEWLGDDPMPKARWLKRDRAHFGYLSDQENHCITAMLKKRIATVDALVATGKPAEVEGLARPMPRNLCELSSVDLMHIALGVKT